MKVHLNSLKLHITMKSEKDTLVVENKIRIFVFIVQNWHITV